MIHKLEFINAPHIHKSIFRKIIFNKTYIFVALGGSIAPEGVLLTVAFVVAVNGKRFVLPLAIALIAVQSVAFELSGLVAQTSGRVFVLTP